MEIKKYIVTQEVDGTKYENIVIIAETCFRTFGNYKVLIEEVRKDFRNDFDIRYYDNIECLSVSKGIAITFPAIPNLTMKGYENTTKSPIY